jgi:hypothetical protein
MYLTGSSGSAPPPILQPNKQLELALTGKVTLEDNPQGHLNQRDLWLQVSFTCICGRPWYWLLPAFCSVMQLRARAWTLGITYLLQQTEE